MPKVAGSPGLSGKLADYVFGLVAGVFVDRHRRQPLLVGADLARAVVLGVIPLAAAFDVLTLPLLIAVVLVFGTLSLVYDAAHQSFPPSLVPGSLLTPAYARLEQSSPVAQTGGPVVAGALIMLRPLHPEVATGIDRPRDLRKEIGEGLAWVYRNSTLGPLAATSHLWFFFQGIFTTVYVLYVLNTLQLSAFLLGVTYAFSGIGAPVGGLLADHLGHRWALWIVVGGMAVKAFLLQRSKFRHARLEESSDRRSDEGLDDVKK